MRLYTLDEAAKVNLNSQHRRYGHEWEELRQGFGELIRLQCACGAIATVTEPKLPEGREVQ